MSALSLVNVSVGDGEPIAVFVVFSRIDACVDR